MLHFSPSLAADPPSRIHQADSQSVGVGLCPLVGLAGCQAARGRPGCDGQEKPPVLLARRLCPTSRWQRPVGMLGAIMCTPPECHGRREWPCCPAVATLSKRGALLPRWGAHNMAVMVVSARAAPCGSGHGFGAVPAFPTVSLARISWVALGVRRVDLSSFRPIL